MGSGGGHGGDWNNYSSGMGGNGGGVLLISAKNVINNGSIISTEPMGDTANTIAAPAAAVQEELFIFSLQA